MEREEGVYEYEVEAREGIDVRRDINKICTANGWPILMMQSAELTLEDIFLKITMGEGIEHLSPAERDGKTVKKIEKQLPPDTKITFEPESKDGGNK